MKQTWGIEKKNETKPKTNLSFRWWWTKNIYKICEPKYYLKKKVNEKLSEHAVYWTENNISGICVLITGFRMFYKVRDDWRSEIVNDCCVFILRGPNNDLVSFFFCLMSVCISYIQTLMKNKNYNPFTVYRVYIQVITKKK